MLSLVKIWPSVLQKKLFRYYLPLEKVLALDLYKLESLSHKGAKFCWNWPVGSGEFLFLILSMYFRYLDNISSWKKCGFSFKQIWIPFSQEWFLPGLVYFGSLFLEKFFKYRQCIFAISLITPLGKECGLEISFEQNLIPFIQGFFVSFGWNWASGFRKKSFFNFNEFSIFLYFFPWAWPFIWTNLKPFHPMILWAKNGWNWPSRPLRQRTKISNIKAYLSHRLRWPKNGLIPLKESYACKLKTIRSFDSRQA